MSTKPLKYITVFFLLILIPACAHGQTFVKGCVTNQATTTAHITVVCSVTSGHDIFIGGAMGSPASSVTCSDSGGSTWVSDGYGSGSGGANSFGCHTLNELGNGSVTFTVTPNSNDYGIVIVNEFFNVSGLDGSAVTGTQTSSTTWTWPNKTTTAKDIIFACGGNENTNATFTAGTSFTIPSGTQSNGGGSAALCQYAIVAAGSYTPTATASTSLAGSLIVVAFKGINATFNPIGPGVL
jgi:hypothetical protein